MRAGTALLAGVLAVACSSCSRDKRVEAGPPPPSGPPVALSCQGRVEGRSETVEVGAAADGVVQVVRVVEGQRVPRGTVLAEIGCEDWKASLREAEAVAESGRQVKVRLLRGSRLEERLSAEQRTAGARAVLEQASSELRRMKRLAANDDIPTSRLDQAQRDFDVAQARHRQAVRDEELVKAPALPEEVAKADADIRTAERRIETIREKIGKCVVTAPIDGTVLRVLLRAGESFSTITPHPLFQLADLSVRRVRAEVDERDVQKVRVGQKALVFQESRRERTFTGVVQSIYRTMGRRQTLSGDPAEKSDRDILETMILLGRDGLDLPVGLRVIVQFLK